MKSHFGLFLVLILFLKILAARYFPVFADETYYYIWSLHPQLSYFDHPPMVAWLIKLGHTVLTDSGSVSLRALFIVLSLFTNIIWIKTLILSGFEKKQTLWTMILLNLNPLLGIGSVLATPDVPLVFFWSLSYYFFLLLLNQPSYKWYALLGATLGLGFCSKYHIVLFVFSGLIYLVFSRRWKSILPLGVLFTLFFGALFSLPVLIWNWQNEWSSFKFQLDHGFGENQFSWNQPFGYIMVQFLLISPLVFLAFFKSNKKGPAEKTPDWYFSISQLGFFLYSSFKSVVEGNWPITSHIHSILFYTNQLNSKRFYITVLYWFAVYTALSLYMFSPQSQSVKNAQLFSSQTETLALNSSQYQPLYASNYQLAAMLTWQTKSLVPKLNSFGRYDFFDTLEESKPNHNSFYVVKYNYTDWPETYTGFKRKLVQQFDNGRLEIYQFSYE